MVDLRTWALEATRHDQGELYRLAAEAKVSSYELTRWMRGEEDVDGATTSRLFVALRRRPVRSRPKMRRKRRRRPPVQTEMF